MTTLRNIIGQNRLDEVLKERAHINSALLQIVDAATETWGVKIELVEIKDVEIPESMPRAMAREAEAIREKRARIRKAEAELEASRKLTQGALEMQKSPLSLKLRRMQMLFAIGIDNNTTAVVLIPSEFAHAAKILAPLLVAAPATSPQPSRRSGYQKRLEGAEQIVRGFEPEALHRKPAAGYGVHHASAPGSRRIELRPESYGIMARNGFDTTKRGVV